MARLVRNENLSESDLARMSDGYCIDCGHRGFVLGPRGGASINISCGGCGHRFNVAMASIRPGFIWGHRNEREDGA